MKAIQPLVVAVVGTMILACPAFGQEAANKPKQDVAEKSSFIQPNEWWNLYFEKGNDPLKRGAAYSNAVKVLEIDPIRPSWIKIKYPMDAKKHLSILRPLKAVHESEKLSLDDELAKWEGTISKWKTTWINLRYVVRMTKVEPWDGVFR